MTTAFDLNVFRNKAINYPLSVIIGFIIFLLVHWLCSYTHLQDWMPNTSFFRKLYLIVLFVASMLFVWETSPGTVLAQTQAEVLFFGQETGWILQPGKYFLFFSKFGVFTIYNMEVEQLINRDVKFSHKNQDKTGKMIVILTDGNWAVGPTTQDFLNFRAYEDFDMDKNVQVLLTNTENRIFVQKDFWTELSIDDMCSLITEDETFKNTCKKYGIVFNNLSIGVTSANLAQDDLNAYVRRLTKELRADNIYSDDQILKIVQTQLKLQTQVQINGTGKPEVLNRVTTGKP